MFQNWKCVHCECFARTHKSSISWTVVSSSFLLRLAAFFLLLFAFHCLSVRSHVPWNYYTNRFSFHSRLVRSMCGNRIWRNFSFVRKKFFVGEIVLLFFAPHSLSGSIHISDFPGTFSLAVKLFNHASLFRSLSSCISINFNAKMWFSFISLAFWLSSAGSSPEARWSRGECWLLLGRYGAVKCEK